MAPVTIKICVDPKLNFGAFYPINIPRGRGLLIRVQVLTLWSGIQKILQAKEYGVRNSTLILVLPVFCGSFSALSMSIVSSEFLCDVGCKQKGSQRPLYDYPRAKLAIILFRLWNYSIFGKRMVWCPQVASKCDRLSDFEHRAGRMA
jgi:hypothetical protein